MPRRSSPELLDDAVPTRAYAMLPMVGLGGSAGGIAALQAFFEATPAETGLAFVVVMHLAADHESLLAPILQRSTTMPVHQVRDSARVEANHVYVIPPGKTIASANGYLHCTDITPDRGRRVAVDLFFRTLADTHGPRAAAIVLSGADGDGAIGIKRIKERGGLTIAQDPDEAEHAGHAARGDRHRHDRLGAARRRDAGPGRPLSRAARPAQAAARGRAAAGTVGRRSRPTSARPRCATCSPICGRRPAATSATTSGRRSCAGSPGA